MGDPPVKTGDLLAGKYRVEKILGAGAMGMVLAATQIALDRRVALKFMMGGGVGKEQHEARFLREARVASKLQSQHAARVLDMGTLESGAPYIVMEFLDGKDLAAVLNERGPLPVEEAVTYIAQVCEAVAEAHAAGIVHRDIKPANLFLAKGVDGLPCLKLVDFGVAKLADTGLDLTATAQILGSPLYMPPESMNGAKDVDGRADIWALGVTLYELLAQSTPFQAETLAGLVTRVCIREPTPIEQFRPDVPPGLAAVIMQCFEKERDRRWPTVAAFVAALAPYASARASYAERVARTQQADVSPSRPTDLLPAAPNPARGADPGAASPLVTSAGLAVPATRAPQVQPRMAAILGIALILALSLAVFFGLRSRAVSPADSTSLALASTTDPTASTTDAVPVVAVTATTATANAAPPIPAAPTVTTANATPRTKPGAGTRPASAAPTVAPTFGGSRR